MVLQLGICSIYYIFVCDHAIEVVESFTRPGIYSKIYYMIVAFIPFLIVALIRFAFISSLILLYIFRNIKIMSYISLVGNIFMISSIVLIFTVIPHFYIPKHLFFQQLVLAEHKWRSLPWITDFDGIVLASGAIIYSFEGQAMVLPLENRMKHGSEMRGWTGVLSTGMALVRIFTCYRNP